MAKKNGGWKEQALLLIYQVRRQIFRAIFPPSIAVATEFLFLLLFFPQVQVQMRPPLPPSPIFLLSGIIPVISLAARCCFGSEITRRGKKKKESAKWPWRLIREIQWQSFPGGDMDRGNGPKIHATELETRSRFFLNACLLHQASVNPGASVPHQLFSLVRLAHQADFAALRLWCLKRAVGQQRQGGRYTQYIHSQTPPTWKTNLRRP